MKHRKTHRLLSAILTRGSSRRTGTDKAFLSWQGKPLIDHALGAVAALPGDTIIVTKRPEAYGSLGIDVVTDRYEVETPISGILTAADYAETHGCEWILITGGDTVPIADHLFDGMWGEAGTGADGDSDTRAILLEVSGRLQPLPAIYHLSSIPAWRAAYRSGDFHLTPVARLLPSRVLKFRNAPYLNINTHGELSAFEQTTA